LQALGFFSSNVQESGALDFLLVHATNTLGFEASNFFPYDD